MFIINNGQKMGWLYLLTASVFEVGWPLGLKLADTAEYKLVWVLFAIISMALSGYFLFLAQKQIPIGTAYAVWTGIGMLGTFVLGAVLFHDTVNTVKSIGVVLILSGIIILKLN